MKKIEIQKRLKREQTKTTEGEFLYELKTSYELSPKVSESIIETAKKYLLRDRNLREGQIEVTLISIEERAGKLAENMNRRRIVLTIDNVIEDRKTEREFGRISLRQIRIQRITDEAIEQDGIMSQEDIARVLNCDTRTIQRDIQDIKQKGIEVITRGVLHNIGRGQTHKVKIVGMYLDGNTYSEIKLKTRHSIGAIKRYIESFMKVLAVNKYGIKGLNTRSIVTGLSENLVRQYTELIKESSTDTHRREKMQEMIESWEKSEELKKRMQRSGNRAVVTAGGVV